MKQRLFIFGASGFIGRRILEIFSRNPGFEAIGFSSRQCDLLSKTSLTKALFQAREADTIVFASAITRTMDDSFDAMMKNIRMAENVSWLVSRRPVAQVIFLSTVEVYGSVSDGTAIHEGMVPSPNNYYGISKMTAEYLLHKAAACNAFTLTVFRLPGIYGPGGESKSVINAMISSAKRKGTITVHGSGIQQRDYVYVDDIPALVEAAILHRPQATVNVATGKGRSIVDIARRIADSMAAPCTLTFQEAALREGARPRHMVFDISFLRRLFPDLTLTDMDQGIERIVGLSGGKTYPEESRTAT